MNHIAVITTGGKQYIVQEGQQITVEKLPNEIGDSVEFTALLVSDPEGNDVKIGTPAVGGAVVKAKVLETGRAKKISVIKYKPKSRYRRNVGHRQPFTKLTIEKITA